MALQKKRPSLPGRQAGKQASKQGKTRLIPSLLAVWKEEKLLKRDLQLIDGKKRKEEEEEARTLVWTFFSARGYRRDQERASYITIYISSHASRI